MAKVKLSLPWLFCLPAVLTLLLVAGWPLARTFYFSLTDASLWNLDEAGWVAFENFVILFQDRDWWRSVANTLVFTLASVSLETILGLSIALVLNSAFRGRSILRASVLIPWAIPSVICARMWAWMFHDLFGVINHILMKLHLIQEPIAWLANDRLSMMAAIMVDVWKTTPFMALLILAGLQTLPKSVFEAAKVDGIPPFKRFTQITLPLLKPSLFVAVVFRSLDALRIFDLTNVLMTNSKSTAVMSVFARRQLVEFQDFGFGSAASVGIFLMIALCTLLLIFSFQPKETAR